MPFSDDSHLAACDVMILAFAARRHAEHLAGIGACPPQLAKRIRSELDRAQALLDTATGSPRSPDVGACRDERAGGNHGPLSLFGGT